MIKAVETNEFLLFARHGLQHLKRGTIEVGLELDLHGLTVDVARRVLAEFLTECGHRRVRGARIIHSKGICSSERQLVWKQKVNSLVHRDEITRITFG